MNRTHLGIRPYECEHAGLGCNFTAAAPRTAKRHSKTCGKSPHKMGPPVSQGDLPGAPDDQLLDLDPSVTEQPSGVSNFYYYYPCFIVIIPGHRQACSRSLP